LKNRPDEDDEDDEEDFSLFLFVGPLLAELCNAPDVVPDFPSFPATLPFSMDGRGGVGKLSVDSVALRTFIRGEEGDSLFEAGEIDCARDVFYKQNFSNGFRLILKNIPLPRVTLDEYTL